MKNENKFLSIGRIKANQEKCRDRKRRKIFLASILITFAFSSSAQATLISLNSVYGADSVTLDTNTGLEWLDVDTPLVYQQQNGLRSYNQVLSEVGAGGLFEGFRYAYRSEVEALLFNSFGFDPVTSTPSNTPTEADKVAAGSLMSFLDYTLGWDLGGGSFSKVLDAVFDDENPDSPTGAMYVFFGVDHRQNLTGGSINFYSQAYINSNPNIYGHFLVRQSAINVDEPPAISLAMLSLALVFGWFQRKRRVNG
ncbi:MAG TPA: hypothetical protein VM553_14610 [Dongiaceae bacterium]|nr:hypothetical protein [Dongiaceae bacterium]